MKGIMIYKIIKQDYFQDLLRPELDEFCKEAQVTSTLL